MSEGKLSTKFERRCGEAGRKLQSAPLREWQQLLRNGRLRPLAAANRPPRSSSGQAAMPG